MITHYVYLSMYHPGGDLVIDAAAYRADRKPHDGKVLFMGERRREWIPVEDCVTRNEAHATAKQIVEVLEALGEEPTVYDYAASVVLNANWSAVVEK